MGSCSYNCVELPDHEKVQCGEYLKGGILDIGILDCDHTIVDFSDQAEVQAAIDDGSLTIITNIKGQVPEPAPIEGENPLACGSETITDGFDRTATWVDSNVTADNISFYNALNKRTAFMILYYCEDDNIRVVTTPIQFIAKDIDPASNKERRTFLVEAKWSEFDMAPLFDAPNGIFGQSS